MAVDRKTKILFHTGSLEGGGAQRVIVTLLRELDRERFESHLVLWRREGVYFDLLPSDVPVIAFPGGPGSRMHNIAQLGRIIEDVQPDLVPRVRLRTASSHWLVLHASRLSGQSAQRHIAVIFEVARPTEVAPLIVLAYDLTKRESEILQSVVRGLSTAEIAEIFHISSNTVQDHLKSVFTKCGAGSRGELVARLFFDHFAPSLRS